MKNLFKSIILGFMFTALTANAGVYLFAPSGATQSNGYIFYDDTGKLGIGTSTSALLTVSNQTMVQQPLANTLVHFSAGDGIPLRISADSYNSNSVFGSQMQFRRARGTALNPSAIAANDIIMSLSGNGWGDTAFAGNSIGSMQLVAEGTFTDTSRPTHLDFFTDPSGATFPVERMRITAAGNVGIATTSPYAPLSVAGQIAGAYFTGTTTATSTFGGSIVSSGVGTSTFAGGITLSGGCISVGGVCLGASVSLVASVFGRTGIVTAQSGDYTTAQVTESGNLYFTNGRAQSAMAGLYEVPLSVTYPIIRTANTLSFPATSTLYAGVNGQHLVFKNGAWTSEATTTFSAPFVFAGGNVTCSTATASVFGCLASADFTTFNAKQATIGVTYPVTLTGATVGVSYGTTTNNTWSGINYHTSNLIVGTSSISAQLGVTGVIAAQTPLFDVASTSLAYATSSLFRVNASGNVGVGTSTPYGIFSVQATSSTLTGTSKPAIVVASSTLRTLWGVDQWGAQMVGVQSAQAGAGNRCSGTSTPVAGKVTISTGCVHTYSQINISLATVNLGTCIQRTSSTYVATSTVDGVSFVASSTSAITDVCPVFWEIKQVQY